MLKFISTITNEQNHKYRTRRTSLHALAGPWRRASPLPPPGRAAAAAAAHWPTPTPASAQPQLAGPQPAHGGGSPGCTATAGCRPPPAPIPARLVGRAAAAAARWPARARAGPRSVEARRPAAALGGASLGCAATVGHRAAPPPIPTRLAVRAAVAANRPLPAPGRKEGI